MVFSVINKLHIPWFQGINKVALSFIFIFRGSSGILVLLSILRKWVSWFYFSSFDWRQFLGFSFIACGRIILKVLDLMMRKWMFFFKVFPSEKFDFFSFNKGTKNRPLNGAPPWNIQINWGQWVSSSLLSLPNIPLNRKCGIKCITP